MRVTARGVMMIFAQLNIKTSPEIFLMCWYLSWNCLSTWSLAFCLLTCG